MDLKKLRELLRIPIEGLSTAGTHRELEFVLEKAGLKEAGGGSKRERMRDALQQTPDEHLPRVADSLLANYHVDGDTRIKIQDVLWAGVGPEIPVRVRHEIASALEAIRDDQGGGLFLRFDEFAALFDRLFDMGKYDSDFFRSERDKLRKWFLENPNDITVTQLFERVGAFDAIHKRFALLLEGLCSWRVQPDERWQREIVDALNDPLGRANLEMAEVGEDGGYPVFALATKRAGVAGRPKNIIFGGQIRPDLVLRDAVNNDIEIASNADKVLVYDRQIGVSGLTWAELRAWWADLRGIANDRKAAEALYRTLLASIPETSPPERFLFRTFFTLFKDSLDLRPALIPEVWLHWDPMTVQQRGTHRILPRFRMDFLILFSPRERVVLEVDGKHHYADDERASPTKYGEMARADRALRLSGYEVYRFGATELDGDAGKSMLRDFFEALFKKHSR